MLLFVFFAFAMSVYCSLDLVAITDISFNIRDYQHTCYLLGHEPTELSKEKLPSLKAFMKEKKLTNAVFGRQWVDNRDYEEDETISDILFFEAEPEKAYKTALLMSLSTKNIKAHEARMISNNCYVDIPKNLISTTIICQMRGEDSTYTLSDKFAKKHPDYRSGLMKARVDKQKLGADKVKHEFLKLLKAKKRTTKHKVVATEAVIPTENSGFPSPSTFNVSTESSFASSLNSP